jgi:hypothetical protein
MLVYVDPAAPTNKGVLGVKLTRTPAERPQNRMLDDEPSESMLRCGCRAEGMDPRVLQITSLMIFTLLGVSTGRSVVGE